MRNLRCHTGRDLDGNAVIRFSRRELIGEFKCAAADGYLFGILVKLCFSRRGYHDICLGHFEKPVSAMLLDPFSHGPDIKNPCQPC